MHASPVSGSIRQGQVKELPCCQLQPKLGRGPGLIIGNSLDDNLPWQTLVMGGFLAYNMPSNPKNKRIAWLTGDQRCEGGEAEERVQCLSIKGADELGLGVKKRRARDCWAYKLLLGPTEKKAPDGALNTGGSVGEARSRANHGHSSGHHPNHGLDNRVHEVVGSAFRGGPYTTQLLQAERDSEPTKIVPEWCHGEHEWLVGSYEDWKRWPGPSSISRRLDQVV
ncbi:hypothetical protein K443DRAFT_126146 [Laccaria amethystina LaAM-08-1]|uniref:Uncharacterized protein n=1 Tax=Laccaria amethystina LaAM-08-1 TaxID=1095629 RepID=A0A0C9X2B3_9AGAR|nr:hypothetical protein K443DRAFT_126146 [Laccaria amethystina LaAM-08-1]